MANQREQSKKDWESRDTSEDLQLGCLQRIADASEKMASNYTQLQKDLDYYKNGYKVRWEIIEKKNKSISALRGQITKLKNKIALIEKL